MALGVGLIAGFMLGMTEIEKRIVQQKEIRQVEESKRNLFFQKQAKVSISEVMSSNTLTILDGFGFSSDWIEFHNQGDETVNLRDAGLSTDIDDPMMWVFPDFEIAPNEHKIVFASGLDEVDRNGNVHTNFKLNAEFGEGLFFTTALGSLISSLELPSMDSDISFGINADEEWVYFNHPSPNEKNNSPGQKSANFNIYLDKPLMITEYMINNQSVLYDEYGDFVDWIEFYNNSDQPLSLANLFLTDDKTELRKWAFPAVDIPPRSYLLVYASGKDEIAENIHTNFRLSAYETLVVSNQFNERWLEVTVEDLLADISRGIKEGQWLYFSEATPGEANSTHGFEEPLQPSSKEWDVLINEVMARNNTFLADAHGNYHDWIELKNTTDRDINLAGYSIFTGSEQDQAYTFGDYILPANAYAVFFADKEVQGEGTDNYLPFSIGASGERLYLCDAGCLEMQSFETGFLGPNLSSGLNEQGERVFFEEPSPNEANPMSYAHRYTEPVEFSLSGGEISSGQLLALSAEEGAKIYFTVDGSAPTAADREYVDPIELNASMTVRAIAIVEGQLPSVVQTHTYIVGVGHDLPIIALSTDPIHLFGEVGIYDNWDWLSERPVHVALYEKDGLGFSLDAGMQIAGGYSRALAQKSFAIHLRRDYGTAELNYPLFEGNEVTSFKHFTLRTSGQDQYMTKIRDAFIHKAVMDVIDLDVMDSRPVVVYINGEYWGLYNIRERDNEDYLASHYGLDPDQLDILVYNGKVLAGTDASYRDLVDYVSSHDLQNEDVYDYVTSQIDIENLIDYLVVQSFFGNTDTGNIKYWRDQNGGKWRWILYDLDWALFRGTHEWNNLVEIFNPEGMGATDWIDTTLYISLLSNETFRQTIIQKYASYIDTHFSPDRLIPLFDAMVGDIESEMARHAERWPNPWGSWEEHVAIVRQIILEKPEIEKDNLRAFFELSDSEMQVLFMQDQ